MPDDSAAYIKQLQEEITRKEGEKQALLEEFRTNITEVADFSAEDLKKRFKVLLAVAYEQLATLVSGADSESVRLSAAKYIFDIGLGKTIIKDTNDPDAKVAGLLEQLLDDPSPPSNTKQKGNK